MSEAPRPVITLPPGAVSAIKSVHPAVKRAVAATMLEGYFGESMVPTFRDRLYHYCSFRALMWEWKVA